jgi:hypothetical protein
MKESRNAYRLLVGRPEGRRLPRRPRYRWVDNIKINIRRLGWGDMEWIDLTQDGYHRRALVNTV